MCLCWEGARATTSRFSHSSRSQSSERGPHWSSSPCGGCWALAGWPVGQRARGYPPRGFPPRSILRSTSVRISLADRDVLEYFQSLEHLLRYCARPAFALDRLSVVPGTGHRPERVRYTLPRHKRGNWVGPGRTEKSTRPGASGVIELMPFEFLNQLAKQALPPWRHRDRYQEAFGPSHPLRRAVTAAAIGNLSSQREAKTGEHTVVPAAASRGCCGRSPPRLVWLRFRAMAGRSLPSFMLPALPSIGQSGLVAIASVVPRWMPASIRPGGRCLTADDRTEPAKDGKNGNSVGHCSQGDADVIGLRSRE